MYPEISESERFPLLTAPGRKLLYALREDPQAPRWNWPNGEQLDAAGVQRVRAFAEALGRQRPAGPGRLPGWVPAFVDFCLDDVPFYRARSAPGTRFGAIPSCCRDDLAPQVWAFVPDSQPLEQLIVFSSSGTTGHPAKMPTHPAAAACGVPLLEHALAPLGATLPRGADGVAITNIAAYRGAYTTAIVMAYLEEAGCVRVNLVPDDWNAPGDCRAYLDRCRAPVVLGDPIAFAELQRVGLRDAPQALISSIALLTDAFARDLEQHFGCPVLDLYALTEAGIVAVKTAHGHAVLPHDVYVEILDEHDEPCQPGVRGEVTLTGGRNPFAPLLRYRSGDFASLAWHDDRPVLVDLEGRQPVLFLTRSGRIVHSMEVSHALRPLRLEQFYLHENSDGAFRFGYRGAVEPADIEAALQPLLGPHAALDMAALPAQPDRFRKIQSYRSERPVDGFPGTGLEARGR